MIRPILLAAVLSTTMTSLAHGQAIVGSWFLRYDGEDGTGTAVITFLPNGVYTMAEEGSGDDPSGHDGMERGTYKWNPSTKTLTKKTLVDTNGEWSLSHTIVESVSVSGNKMTLVADDGKFTLDRVTSKNNGLVGGWYMSTGGGSYAVVTFLSNGNYYMVQDGKKGEGGKSGMEWGSYKWSFVTKSFTRKLFIDTNGTWGFSDNQKRSVTISGNNLNMEVQGEGKFALKRVVAPK